MSEAGTAGTSPHTPARKLCLGLGLCENLLCRTENNIFTHSVGKRSQISELFPQHQYLKKKKKRFSETFLFVIFMKTTRVITSKMVVLHCVLPGNVR